MSEIIQFDTDTALNFNQRWNSYLAIALAVVTAFIGVTLRDGALNATVTFEDLESGVRAQVPADWLLDSRATTEYVFRVQDPNSLPFKTTLQVTFLAVGPNATPRNVLDEININRAKQLSAYRPISTAEVTLRDGTPASRMVYAYTQDERNPFLESLPVVVQGVDVVVLRRSQAAVITYREEINAFDDNLYRFENLLDTLEIF